MNAMSFLSQARMLEDKAQEKLDAAAKLRASLFSITAKPKDDIVSGGGSQDKFGETLAKVIDLEREANEYIDRKIDMAKVVKRIESERQRKILLKHYFWGKRLGLVAYEMHLSLRTVKTHHKKAIESLQEILNNCENA